MSQNYLIDGSGTNPPVQAFESGPYLVQQRPSSKIAKIFSATCVMIAFVNFI